MRCMESRKMIMGGVFPPIVLEKLVNGKRKVRNPMDIFKTEHLNSFILNIRLWYN